MLWAALLLPPGPDGAPPSDEALRGVATWALQFTPRVATSEEAVLLELEASARLFGGKRALRDRILQEGADQGVSALAWATNSLAAHLLARAGIVNSAQLKRGRRYAVVIIFAVAAFLTPPDFFSQIALGVPTLLLYELSIFSVRWMEKKKEEGEQEESEA